MGSLKNPIFSRGHEKPIYWVGLPKKGGLDSFQIQEVAGQKRGGGGNIPMHTVSNTQKRLLKIPHYLYIYLYTQMFCW